jgi:hypothetical protein
MLKTLFICVILGLLDQPLFAQTTNNLAPSAPGRDLDTPDIVAARYLKKRNGD